MHNKRRDSLFIKFGKDNVSFLYKLQPENVMCLFFLLLWLKETVIYLQNYAVNHAGPFFTILQTCLTQGQTIK